MALVRFYEITLSDAKDLRNWEVDVLVEEMEKAQRAERRKQRRGG